MADLTVFVPGSDVPGQGQKAAMCYLCEGSDSKVVEVVIGYCVGCGKPVCRKHSRVGVEGRQCTSASCLRVRRLEL